VDSIETAIDGKQVLINPTAQPKASRLPSLWTMALLSSSCTLTDPSRSTLMFDYTQLETDGIVALMREKPDNTYSTGFILFDRLPLGSDVRKVGSGGTERVSIVDDSQDARIVLADQIGKERIRLSVDHAGAAKFEILDANGKVVYSAP
jgi:hypothetical protein